MKLFDEAPTAPVWVMAVSFITFLGSAAMIDSESWIPAIVCIVSAICMAASAYRIEQERIEREGDEA